MEQAAVTMKINPDRLARWIAGLDIFEHALDVAEAHARRIRQHRQLVAVATPEVQSFDV